MGLFTLCVALLFFICFFVGAVPGHGKMTDGPNEFGLHIVPIWAILGNFVLSDPRFRESVVFYTGTAQV